MSFFIWSKAESNAVPYLKKEISFEIDLIARLRLYRKADVMRGGEFDGTRVTRIGVAENPQPRNVGDNALQSALGPRSPGGNDHHPDVLPKPDPDSTAIMDRYPRRSRCSVDEGVEQWPVCD